MGFALVDTTTTQRTTHATQRHAPSFNESHAARLRTNPQHGQSHFFLLSDPPTGGLPLSRLVVVLDDQARFIEEGSHQVLQLPPGFPHEESHLFLPLTDSIFPSSVCRKSLPAQLSHRHTDTPFSPATDEPHGNCRAARRHANT